MSTRSELKENLLAARLEGVLQWILVNRPKVLGAGGFLIAAILIGSVFFLRQSEITETNWTRLTQAQILISNQNTTQAKQILQEIRSGSSGPLSLYASFYLGEAALTEKNYDDAIKYFSETVDRSGKSPVKPLALEDVGFAYEQKKDYNGAAQTYGRFLEKFSEHFLAARTQLQLGRCLLLAGRTDEAKKTLEGLVDLYPTSEWATQARSLMDKIQSR